MPSSTPSPEHYATAREIAGGATGCPHAFGLDTHQLECDKVTDAIAHVLHDAIAGLRQERDARRQSLANEIRRGLKSRGVKWVPENPADLIPAVGQALDAAAARAEAAEQERDTLKLALANASEIDKHNQSVYREKIKAAEAEQDEWRDRCEQREARAILAEQEVAALRAALEPSAETKAAYIAEFVFNIEDGDALRSVSVPWTTIKEIMAAIRARALRPGTPKENPNG